MYYTYFNGIEIIILGVFHMKVLFLLSKIFGKSFKKGSIVILMIYK